MPRLLGRRAPGVVEAIPVPDGRGDQFVDVDRVEADDAHVDIGAAEHVRRAAPIVDMNPAARAEEMMRDRIAASILRRLARNANVSRLDAGEPEPRLGAITAIAFGRAGGEVELDLEAQRAAMAAALMGAFHGARAPTIMS